MITTLKKLAMLALIFTVFSCGEEEDTNVETPNSGIIAGIGLPQKMTSEEVDALIESNFDENPSELSVVEKLELLEKFAKSNAISSLSSARTSEDGDRSTNFDWVWGAIQYNGIIEIDTNSGGHELYSNPSVFIEREDTDHSFDSLIGATAAAERIINGQVQDGNAFDQKTLPNGLNCGSNHVQILARAYLKQNGTNYADVKVKCD